MIHLTKYLQENFRLLKLIHSSDKTKLWLIENLKSEEKFLLKVIGRTNLLYSQLAGIKNSALPKIFYVEESDKATYVVEEFLRGLDLKKNFDTRGALDEQTACRLAIEICNGLKKLHKWHIIHRDMCIEFDPNKRFQSAESLRRAIIRRRHFHRWKKFLVVVSVGVASLSGYFFQPSSESVASVEIPAVEKIQPTETKPSSVQPVAEDFLTEQPTEPEESFAAEEIFSPHDEPIYYDDEPAPQPTFEPATTEEATPKNLAREIDYSAANSSELTGSFMPREVFARNENWSEENATLLSRNLIAEQNTP